MPHLPRPAARSTRGAPSQVAVDLGRIPPARPGWLPCESRKRRGDTPNTHIKPLFSQAQRSQIR